MSLRGDQSGCCVLYAGCFAVYIIRGFRIAIGDVNFSRATMVLRFYIK
jgi:hypothetical protein